MFITSQNYSNCDSKETSLERITSGCPQKERPQLRYTIYTTLGHEKEKKREKKKGGKPITVQ